VATADAAEPAGAPEAVLLGMLKAGQVNAGQADARPLARLGDRDLVVLRRDATGTGFVSAIEQIDVDHAFDAMMAGSDALAAILLGIPFVAMLFFLLPLSQARRSRIVSERFYEDRIMVGTMRRPTPDMSSPIDREPIMVPLSVALMAAIATRLMTMSRRAYRVAGQRIATRVGWLPANFRPAPHALMVGTTR
jgi:hypothetical protein